MLGFYSLDKPQEYYLLSYSHGDTFRCFGALASLHIPREAVFDYGPFSVNVILALLHQLL